MAEFVHLHGHSEYSLLDGGCHIKEIPVQAAEYGMSALAVTDHGNLFGAVAHYNACQKAEIKPIIGCEVYVAIESRFSRGPARGITSGSNHMVLLAQNDVGYKNLTKLVSKGYTEGYYYNPRIDKELLRQHADGLICLSACISGEVPHLIYREGLAEAEKAVRTYMDIFGDNYYLEIQRHGIDREAKINDGLVRLNQKLGVPLVATNDFHFLRAEDHAAHDALICIQTGKKIAEEKRMCYEKGLYMKSADEMYKLFNDMPEVAENTVAIAEKCHLEMSFGQMYMPNFPTPEQFANDADYLTHLSQEGLQRRYGHIDTELQERLDFELSVINKMGYAGYFLIVQDYVLFAKNNGISVGPGRGSVAGSLVAYCVRITDTDPIKHKLLFERFLQPERIGMPDIDIDFADTGRDKVIRYVIDKYGEANVAQVITFATMKAKAVIRDVGRVLGMSYDDVDRIAKLVPNDLGITLDQAIEEVPDLKAMSLAKDEKGQLIAHALKLEGLSRHCSVHAAAVIIAPSDITDYVPLYRAPKDGRISTQYDGPTCEDMGLLKMDFLGLKELSLMDEAVALIRLTEPEFDLDKVPWDDGPTFALFGRGETVGVFQFESAGMREYLKQLKPDKLEDVIAMNALYRPGPMQRIPLFINRKHGREPVEYAHPVLEPVLEETYGVITYQEQVQRIARDMAGFTLGQADGIRKAMGKKLVELMEKYEKDFVEGAHNNGIDRKIAKEVWSDIQVFSGYGFNKSHSASYSEVAYKNAYLKANYPRQYMAASLTMDRNNTDRLTILLDECRRMEIPVLPPNVNESALNFAPTPDGIHFGLAAIKNVGESAAQSIVDTRLEHGSAKTLFEFCQRLDLRTVNRRALESLIAAGALDTFEGHRAQLQEGLDLALKSAQKAQEAHNRGQISLFDVGDGNDNANELEQIPLPEVEPWGETEALAKERELLGFYISSHPLSRYSVDLEHFTQPLSDLEHKQDGERMRVGGLISRISTLNDKRGQTLAFVTLEDQADKGDVAFFSDVYESSRELIEADRVILVEGRVSERNGRKSLRAESAMPMDQARTQLTKSVDLLLPYEKINEEVLDQLLVLCQRYSGPCELRLHVQNDGQKDAVVRSRTIKVNPCDDLLKAVDHLIGPKRARLTVQHQVSRPSAPSEHQNRRFAAQA
jgi:DNA polymerase-3 subunit alpha